MMRQHLTRALLAALLLWACGAAVCSGATVSETSAAMLSQRSHTAPGVARLADNPNPPSSAVKLIFIHHSTGGNWLADPNPDQPAGGLGRALMENNYFVSATNYGWGPYSIGDRTDIPNWPEWFTGPDHTSILSALYAESGQNFGEFGWWPRLSQDPGGENQIVLFKSCYPNSDLYGQPNDPPAPAPNDQYTVSNAKAVYNNLLTTFATRRDKLFIVITAPPMGQGEYLSGDQSPAQRAANARAFNDWLVFDWLTGYPYNNVAVFDYYNVLTSNGSAGRVDDPATNGEPNDAGWTDGNHHRWRSGSVQHSQDIPNNYSAYPTDTNWNSHPTSAGQQKATAEFVELLNVFYNRWIGGAAQPTVTATGTSPAPTRTPTPAPTIEPGTGHLVYLPLILKGWTVTRPTPTSTTPPTAPIPSGLVQPSDLAYVGAFRLPGGDTPPQTFAYGGNAMTFNPDGDPSNRDAYPGSLFVMGHDRLAYGALPDGSQVAEVSIPVPGKASDPADLPQAGFIQGFYDVAAGFFTELEEIPKAGMQYLNHPDTGPKIHLCWGQHLQPPDVPSHAWFNPTLATPNMQGVWFIGDHNLYSVNGYMFDIPAAWADAHAQGRYLATGRFRDGGQGGMGPALFAYRPWLADGAAPSPGTHLAETTLLLYENVYNTDDFVRNMNGYQHADEWEGGAWITTPSGKSAVLFAGTKSTGTKFWYGYVNPRGPEYPCVDAQVTDYVTCRMADGSSCPPEDSSGCCDEEQGTCVTGRGWWSTRFDAQLILYDPADLARVAAGEIESWEPQPYAFVDVDEHLYLDPPEWDVYVLGMGVQRRYRIGAAAHDRNNSLLYVLELYADGGKPVVHVWRIQ